jgi:hypothetical protein
MNDQNGSRRANPDVHRGLAILVCVAQYTPAFAGDWYVSNAGKADGAGTVSSPWDLASALGGAQKAVKPGDTIFLIEGTYKIDRAHNEANVSVKLAGAEGKPITIRPAAGAHVIIDGGLQVEDPSAYLVIRDLEILVSEPRPKETLDPDPTYANIKKVRPWGGLNILTGRNCRYVNLVIHDCLQGIGFWQTAVDSEIYGCIIYDNGWAAKDRGHGHAIYTQNKDGTKTIANCIFTGGYGWSMHAYGSPRAYVDNFNIIDNITYETRNEFLVGGGRPSQGIRVADNFFHGASVRIGYTAKDNEDAAFLRNVLCKAGVSFNSYQKVDFQDNTLLAAGVNKTTVKEFLDRGNKTVAQADLAGAKPVVFFRPNKDDPKRAHLAVYVPAAKDAAAETTVPVDAGAMLKDGQKFRLMNPRDLWGKPVLAGTAKGGTIDVPVKGELAVYVLLAD